MRAVAVRRYIDRLPEDATGWLSGLRDDCVGAALTLILDDPGHPWTIEESAPAYAFLARRCMTGSCVWSMMPR